MNTPDDQEITHPITDIVVLVHNRIEITKQFLLHLFENTRNFNIIFVDNGSTDETVQFLGDGEKQGKWTLIRHPANLGVIKGRNSAISRLRSDYLVNIDNDQMVTAGWLECLHDDMSKGFDIVGTEAWQMQPPGSSQVVVFQGKTGDMSYFPIRRCLRENEPFTYIGCGGMLIKRAVIDKIGLFDERFSPAYFEDPDFCFRAIQAGFKLGWCRKAKINHLAHQTISTQTSFNKSAQFNQSWQQFREKWKTYFPPHVRT